MFRIAILFSLFFGIAEDAESSDPFDSGSSSSSEEDPPSDSDVEEIKPKGKGKPPKQKQPKSKKRSPEKKCGPGCECPKCKPPATTPPKPHGKNCICQDCDPHGATCPCIRCRPELYQGNSIHRYAHPSPPTSPQSNDGGYGGVQTVWQPQPQSTPPASRESIPPSLPPQATHSNQNQVYQPTGGNSELSAYLAYSSQQATSFITMAQQQSTSFLNYLAHRRN